MKVVILAAGKGSRLGHHELPKPLTWLSNGISILEWQLQTLQKYISLDDVMVVVGYHKEMIIERFPHLKYIHSKNFASENTSKSLLLALQQCSQHDVLWLNGDVVFHPTVLGKILDLKKTSMVVNVGPVGEEEVKYRESSEGCILEVSKQVELPKGEALGINFVTAADAKMLKKKLEQCDAQDYFERAIELSIEEGMTVWSVHVNRDLCAEVDFPEDLEHARDLLKQWLEKVHH